MFKLSYMDLRSDKFRGAVSKLSLCTGFKDVKLSLQIGRMAKAVDNALQTSQKEWVELADPLLERDDKGNFILNGSGFAFRDGIEAAQAQKAIEAFTTKETIFDHPKLFLKDVAPVGLSPLELVALEPLLATLESL